MGWLYKQNSTLESTIGEYIVDGLFRRGEDQIATRVLDHHYDRTSDRRGTLYVARSTTVIRPGGDVATNRYIVVVLIEHDPKAGWGSKDMECCMGPRPATCPPRLLDLCPPHHRPTNSWCADWHARCRLNTEREEVNAIAAAR